MKSVLAGLLISLTTLLSCAQAENRTNNMTNTDNNKIPDGVKTDTATFGTGCFWCTEAIFQQLNGVFSATSGYSGGHVDNPTYKEVCDGTTGHAEVIQVVYDPSKIKFDELLEVFWQTHD